MTAMEAPQLRTAVASAKACAAMLGLRADDAEVLQASNRLAVRLLPCDVLVRVAPMSHRAGAVLEAEVARQLEGTGAPVAALDPRAEPRVYMHDSFAVTFWTYYEPIPPRDVAPGEYAESLQRLHAGMREIDVGARHC